MSIRPEGLQGDDDNSKDEESIQDIGTVNANKGDDHLTELDNVDHGELTLYSIVDQIKSDQIDD